MIDGLRKLIITGARRTAALPMRAMAALAILSVSFILDLLAGNLWLVSTYTVSSARIAGGEAAATVIRGRLPAVLNWGAVWLSSVSNLPARAAFAWRHAASLKAYDRVIGVHVLGDLYPGLNGPSDEKSAQISVQDVKNKRIRGFAASSGDTASIFSGEARVLVVLNRDDAMEIRLRIEGRGAATVFWNGSQVLQQDLSARALLRFRSNDVRRGANDLVIRAPAGSVVHPIEIEAVR